MIDLNISSYLSQINDTNELYYNDSFLAINGSLLYSSSGNENLFDLTSSSYTSATVSSSYDNETITAATTAAAVQATNDTKKKIDCLEMYNPSDKLNEFEFWVCGVILNIVGILGIFGNILSMVILSRPQMRSSINYLLIGLARCDTALIITSMLLFGIPSIYPYTGYLFYYYYVIYPNISLCLYPIAMAAQTSSVYMTFTVTLERYVAVCHPLKARALCTYGRAKIYFIVCIIFALVYNIPRFWEVIVLASSTIDNDVIFCVVASDLRYNPIYIRIYIHWCYLIFIYFIPFLSLAILNCLIYRQVKKANRERQRLSRTERREIGLATMLLCVVIVFFLLNFLALYTNVLEAFYDVIDDYLVKTSNLLVTINSSANFIIYVIFGEKFKRIFLLLFCKGRMSRDTPDLIHYESSISNGDGTTNRSSGRFSRHGTQRSTTRNGATIVVGGGGGGTTGSLATTMTNVRCSSTRIIKRNRAPSPGPCVYYPARELTRNTGGIGTGTTIPSTNTNNTTMQTIITPNTTINCDWDTKNGLMTSGF